MHYVLLIGVVTLFIYFRFGSKALASTLFVIGLLALSRGLVTLAIPLFIIAFYIMKNTNSPLELPWPKGSRERSKAPLSTHGPRNPVISSHFITIIIDPKTAEISGNVVSGPKQGSRLMNLSIEGLNELLKFYAEKDKESEQILISFMDLNHENWRAKVRGYYESETNIISTTSSRLTKKLAIEILGLRSHPSAEEVKANHRQLMKHFHPDQGGSPFLAAKFNMAKDCLLD